MIIAYIHKIHVNRLWVIDNDDVDDYDDVFVCELMPLLTLNT